MMMMIKSETNIATRWVRAQFARRRGHRRYDDDDDDRQTDDTKQTAIICGDWSAVGVVVIAA